LEIKFYSGLIVRICAIDGEGVIFAIKTKKKGSLMTS